MHENRGAGSRTVDFPKFFGNSAQNQRCMLDRHALGGGRGFFNTDLNLESADPGSALKLVELGTRKYWQVPDFGTHSYQDPIRMKYEQPTFMSTAVLLISGDNLRFLFFLI